MKKLLIIVPILLLAIGGGFILALGNKESGSAATPISAEKAREAALALFPGTIVSFEYDGDDRTPHYEIDIQSTTEEVEVEVNAETGKAVIKEREALRTKQTALTASLTENNAIDIAVRYFASQIQENIDLSKDLNSYITKIELDEDDNVVVYDIELHSNTTKAEIEINANSAEVVKFKKEALKTTQASKPSVNQSQLQAEAQQIKEKAISLQQAIDIALSKVSGTVTKSEIDDNKYEIEIRNGKMEYEFEIDKNGNIISYEEDLDNN